MDNFKIGTKIKAKRDIHYFMGQIDDDKISKDEVCTIDKILNNNRVFVEEHADRYGPWHLSDFVKKNVKTKKQQKNSSKFGKNNNLK